MSKETKRDLKRPPLSAVCTNVFQEAYKYFYTDHPDARRFGLALVLLAGMRESAHARERERERERPCSSVSFIHATFIFLYTCVRIRVFLGYVVCVPLVTWRIIYKKKPLYVFSFRS